MRLLRLGRLGKTCAIPLLAILTASCATTTVSSVKTDATKVACQSFEPISWSAKDTAMTVAQVKEHNAAGKALCGWGRK